LRDGVVRVSRTKTRTARWPQSVVQEVLKYVQRHPTFFLEELQQHIKTVFPTLKNVSLSTVCRALHFDLGLTRKVLIKAAKECVPEEVQIYKSKLEAIYSYPEQMLFVDETSKDGRHAYRRYAWSARNVPAVVNLPFRRGKRVSILAALDCSGFVAWDTTQGTFSRHSFHAAFVKHIVPLLNPWPLPRSIVVMDNAKIHMYAELESVVHMTGARLLFLPPYSPQLNPIEFGFGRLKQWIHRHANLVFPLYPELTLRVAMPSCCKETGFLAVLAHCGYEHGHLKDACFGQLSSSR
jgi:DDE superfamily endonuclease